MSKPKKAVSDTDLSEIVKPELTFAGDPDHPLKAMFAEGTDLPVIRTAGLLQIPNTRKFVSFTLKTQGDKVIAIEVDVPDQRLIAIDNAKTRMDQFILDTELL